MKKWYNYYGVIRKVSDNMAMTKRPKRQYSSEIVNLEDMVPQDHFLRVIEEHFDWNFIYDEVEKLYSNVGRKSIDPVVLIKIHILKFLFHEDVKEIYKQRPQHIERVFADGKMKYGLRSTYFRTKERVHRELTLLYACMNLKKFAIHHYV